MSFPKSPDSRLIYHIVLLMACAFALILAVPTINNNIGDPNRIVYFNADEGGQMDLIWLYFSGERRDSFQFDFDAGLEMPYLSDLAKSVLCRFIDFTPGMFVFILRWIHLLSWIAALVAFWRLIRRHFGEYWKAALGVSLLAVRPAFSYFTLNLKPEPLILFIMIIGLDYALRIIDEPFRKRYFIISVALASLAFIFKFAGIFLLPAIIVSVYFAFRASGEPARNYLPINKMGRFLPAILGISLIALLYAILFLYVRKSTGMTWYEQFGFIGSLRQYKVMYCVFLFGVALIPLTPILFMVERLNNIVAKKAIRRLDTIASYTLFTSGLFLFFIFLFGIKWFFKPEYFITTYGQIGPIFLGTPAIKMISSEGIVLSFIKNIAAKIYDSDPLIFFLFLFYLAVELYNISKKQSTSGRDLFKRLVLVIFLFPFFLSLLSMGRVAQHHMLPFFTAISVLAIEGISLFNQTTVKNVLKRVVVTIAILILISDIIYNGLYTVRTRLYQFNQNEDVSFEVEKWWRGNIPPDAVILADNYTRVYIPEGYKNITSIPLPDRERVSNLRKIFYKIKPRYVYYNEGPCGGVAMPPVKEVFPSANLKLIKTFDTAGRAYIRTHGDKFVIYEVIGEWHAQHGNN